MDSTQQTGGSTGEGAEQRRLDELDRQIAKGREALGDEKYDHHFAEAGKDDGDLPYAPPPPG